jgi:hypothetical protein
MTPIDWIVIATGVAAIAWVNWYFLWTTRHDAQTPAHGHG